MGFMDAPIVKDLVLIGGGHSHGIVLKLWGMNPAPGVRLTLISEVSHTPYSGMLPGYIAGFYNYDQCHIDLRTLGQFAQAQVFIDRVIGLDLEKKRVICATRPPVAFDLLSLNIGSTPATEGVPGAAEFAIPVKPVPLFLQSWQALLERVPSLSQVTIALVGGGAGGVELALNMQTRLQQFRPDVKIKIHLIHKHLELLATHNRQVRRRLTQRLIHQGIQLHLGETIREIKAVPDVSIPQFIVHSLSDFSLQCDQVFWVTHASAPQWIRETGLATTADGFMQVNPYLQSVSHPDVFAAGDIATVIDFPRPKAGVFAVRQGKPLADNLRRRLQNQPLQAYKPQEQFLSLISTGDGQAIASRGQLAGESRWFWRWKDHIDRQFMAKFENLPVMSSPLPVSGTLSPTVINDILGSIQGEVPAPENENQVQTLEYLPALISDPFIWGKIVVNHCLTQIWSQGAIPQTAFALVTLPNQGTEKIEETLFQVLTGVISRLNAVGIPLMGCQTLTGMALGVGLSCNGVRVLREIPRHLAADDCLILTKPLGTGTLLAAHLRHQVKGRWIDQAIASMLQSNQDAVLCLVKQGVSAYIPVNQWGLWGNLMELIADSPVSVELDLSALPRLPGARKTVQRERVPELTASATQRILNFSEMVHHPYYPLLFAPEMAGGFLAVVPQERVEICLKTLREQAYGESQVIGKCRGAG